MTKCFIRFCLVLLIAERLLAAPVNLTLSVDGVKRSALVYPGKKAAIRPSPLVIYFHGFNGTSEDSARRTKFHQLWPRATVAYPQGLKDIVDGTGKKSYGWQRSPRQLGDRDLHFVDALINKLSSQYKVNRRRIYATGHSNGGFLTYALLTERPSTFAAFAPVGCYRADRRSIPPTTPRPVLYIFGKEDHVFDRDPGCPDGGLDCARQTLDWLLKLNRCSSKPLKWRYHGYRKYPPEKSGEPVIWRLYKGGHSWPAYATKVIVRFFKQHKLKSDPVNKADRQQIKPNTDESQKQKSSKNN